MGDRRVVTVTNAKLSRLQWILVYFLSVLPVAVAAEQYHVERLNAGRPIITAEHFLQVGAPLEESDNINGPSVIRVPDWIPKEQRAAPQAQYYLYFAHHHGEYIRLAWAETIEGPWHLYRTGAQAAVGQRGVLDLGPDRQIALASPYTITGHIASPDVHVDHDSKQIVLYFHGATSRHGTHIERQKSYVATSPWGLDFSGSIRPLPLSDSYLRVFEHNGILQGLYSSFHAQPVSSVSPWSGATDRELSADALWRIREATFLQFYGSRKAQGQSGQGHIPYVRHLALYREDNRLHVFFTMKGHKPERILATSVDLDREDWFDVAPAAEPIEVLRAELAWEGAGIQPERSKKGAEFRLVNALRDPFVFYDQGSVYLFYAGGGERAIGVARLTLDRDQQRPDTASD